MARTALYYEVASDKVWNGKKMVKYIISRSCHFFVNGCRSEREELAYLNSFVAYLLTETGYNARNNGFGSGIHYFDRETGEKVEDTYIYIGIQDSEEKKMVEECYRDWKRGEKPLIREELKHSTKK